MSLGTVASAILLPCICGVGDAGVGMDTAISQILKEIKDLGGTAKLRGDTVHSVRFGWCKWDDSKCNRVARLMEKLPKVQTLELTLCTINRPVLTSLSRLKALESLTLSSNQIKDGVQGVIIDLPKLRTLELGGVHIRSLAMFDKVRNLRHLELSGTLVEEKEFFAFVSRLASVEVLVADLAPIPDRSLEALKGLKLKKLRLAYTQITDEGAANIAGIGTLEHLDVEATYITDAGLQELAKLPQLRFLNLRLSNVSATAVDELRRKRPMLEIVY